MLCIRIYSEYKIEVQCSFVLNKLTIARVLSIGILRLSSYSMLIAILLVFATVSNVIIRIHAARHQMSIKISYFPCLNNSVWVVGAILTLLLLSVAGSFFIKLFIIRLPGLSGIHVLLPKSDCIRDAVSFLFILISSQVDFGYLKT